MPNVHHYTGSIPILRHLRGFIVCADMKVAYFLFTIAVVSVAANGRHLMSEQPSSTLANRLSALARDNTVILTLASCGYLEFADNWIAHVEALGISNWLTVAQDATALQYLTERQGAPSRNMHPTVGVCRLVSEDTPVSADQVTLL